jgi:hypothetical protein
MTVRGTLRGLVLLAAAMSAIACRDRAEPSAAALAIEPSARPASTKAPELTDLSSSLAAMRLEFNAHENEKRFLTLVAPT